MDHYDDALPNDASPFFCKHGQDANFCSECEDKAILMAEASLPKAPLALSPALYKAVTQDEQTTLIEDCLKRREAMGDWETSFIESIQKQKGEGKTLSPKQTTILDRIWEKVT